MDLFEYEGKKLLQKYNIKIPKGDLASKSVNKVSFPVVVKSQVLSGGRGKLGGIKTVTESKDLEMVCNKVLNTKINGESASDVYIEEAVNYEKELYVSIIMDRNQKAPVLIVGKEGGVDIEQADESTLLYIPIDPILGLQPYMIKNVDIFLNGQIKEIENLLYNMWNLFTKEQATLIEINPLFLLNEGEYIAGDAKITLDGDGKREENPVLILRNKDSYEFKCSSLNTVGVELDGDVATITSGAGLGMATFDLISSKNISVRTLVDLGGHIIHDKNSAKKLINEVKKLNPKVFLFNFYFQVASCLVMAEAISEELGDRQFPTIIRLKGKDEEQSIRLLSEHKNIYLTEQITSITPILTKVLKERDL